MKESESQPPDILPFPFPLPERMLDQIGYRGPDRLVGLAWEAGDELMVTDSSTVWVGAHNDRPFLSLMRDLRILYWLEEFAIDLGSFQGPPTHWLVVDRTPNQGTILAERRARETVRSQQLPPA